MSRDLRNPKDRSNWELVCEFCGAAWPHQSTMGGTIKPHFDAAHPGRGIRLLTKWIGLGKAPKRLPRFDA